MHDQTSRGWPYSESLSRQDFLIFLYRPSLGETTSFRVYHILAPTILCTGWISSCSWVGYSIKKY